MSADICRRTSGEIRNDLISKDAFLSIGSLAKLESRHRRAKLLHPNVRRSFAQPSPIALHGIDPDRAARTQYDNTENARKNGALDHSLE